MIIEQTLKGLEDLVLGFFPVMVGKNKAPVLGYPPKTEEERRATHGGTPPARQYKQWRI